jgi:hypothetical protein
MLGRDLVVHIPCSNDCWHHRGHCGLPRVIQRARGRFEEVHTNLMIRDPLKVRMRKYQQRPSQFYVAGNGKWPSVDPPVRYIDVETRQWFEASSQANHSTKR